MNLILSGGGDTEQSVNVDALFTSLLGGKKILYIPIALDESKHPYDGCITWLASGLSNNT